MKRSLFAFALLAFCACAPSGPEEDSKLVYEPRYGKNVSTLFWADSTYSGAVAPNFRWKDSLGVEHDLHELRGKIVLVNMWATWCPPCAQEMPALNNIAKDFADDVVVIGVSIDLSGNVFEKVTRYLNQFELGFQTILDPYKIIYRSYTGIDRSNIPWTYVIDRDGNIHRDLLGAKTYAQFKEAIEEVL